jgi:hypothetical protein
MKRREDYVAGSHDYWIHFWCGFFFGAALGVWIGAELFSNGWGLAASSVVSAGLTAYSCGRWGDDAWKWVIKGLLD